MTRVANNQNPEEKEIAAALQRTKKVTPKRKPVGVLATDANSADAAISADDDPNLFVNVMDVVSGRLLYRTSHSNAGFYPTPSIAVSENWVYYSFVNEKSRRAVIGVLSLYDGMIDSKGLTAFASPEQATSFSSLDAREAKPVVLAKSYSIAKPVTALGVTMTKSGISTPRLILATVNGQIYSLDRKTLEPRRPVGNLKEFEKKEGLIQYSEFIHTVSYFSLSYNLTIESATGITAAPTDLESQSLVLAFGGPDLFFIRTSPSRGFDLLPDSFNRVLLTIVVVGLLAVLAETRRRAFKKMLTQGWL
jgi:hypothetical protein